MHPSLKVASLLTLMVSVNAGAHGLWTEERRGSIEAVYGHGAEDNAYKAEKIKRAWAFDATGNMVPVTVERLADHAVLQPLTPPAALAVLLDNGPWSQRPDKQWVNQDRTHVKDAIASTHSLKYSLAIYQSGARLPKLDMLRLAIVPLSDPLQVGPGKTLEVQVLLDGKPAADIPLQGDYRGALTRSAPPPTSKAGHVLPYAMKDSTSSRPRLPCQWQTAAPWPSRVCSVH